MKLLLAIAVVCLTSSVHGTAVHMTNEDDLSFVYDESMWEQDMDDLANGATDYVDVGVKKIPCCTPDQWEGGASESIEYITFGPHPHDENDLDRRRPHPRPRPRPRMGKVFDLMEVHADFKNGRVAVEEHVFTREGGKNISVIIDAGQQAMFVVFPDKKFCKKVPYTGNITGQCVPDSAKYLGSATFGLGDNSLDYDAFGFRFRSREMSVGALGVVTSDSCAPVSEAGKGRRGRTFFRYSQAFFNLKAGVKDPKVFTPPAYCGQEMEEDIDIDSHPVVQFASRKFMN